MPYDPQPLLDLRDKLLPPGGPAFDTGAFGGPEGLSPWAMNLWNFARRLIDPSITKEQGQIGSPLGLVGGTGIVTGPMRPIMSRAQPKLTSFFERDPRTVGMYPTPPKASSIGYTFVPEKHILTSDAGMPPKQAFDNVINMMINPTIEKGTSPLDTAIHEGLHGAYGLKGDVGYPPSSYIDKLFEFFANKGLIPPGRDIGIASLHPTWPDAELRGRQEAIIEAMTQNILNRRGLGGHGKVYGMFTDYFQKEQQPPWARNLIGPVK